MLDGLARAQCPVGKMAYAMRSASVLIKNVDVRGVPFFFLFSISNIASIR